MVFESLSALSNIRPPICTFRLESFHNHHHAMVFCKFLFMVQKEVSIHRVERTGIISDGFFGSKQHLPQ